MKIHIDTGEQLLEKYPTMEAISIAPHLANRLTTWMARNSRERNGFNFDYVNHLTNFKFWY